MTKFLIINQQKLKIFLYCALCISLLLFVSDCGDTDYSSSETGSISFSVEWRGAPTKQPYETGFRALDCSAAGVASVEAEIYDENDSYLTSGAPWLCSAHAGTIENVPEGTNRKIVVLGRDVNNNVIYRGEKSGITVTTGQTTNAGTIVVDPVSTAPTATITSPSDNSSYNQGDTITFSGTGSDPEDGTLTGGSLVWTSSLDGQIGTGTSFTATSLSVGAHTITLTATDSDGATGGDTVTITVNEPSTHYTDNGNGTITDDVTGLMWQKEDDDIMRIWDDSISCCNDLTLGSYSDWRLPSITELSSIIDNSAHNPSIDTTYFPGTNAQDWWSSTTHADDSSDAWFVDFYSGSVSYYGKPATCYVRCVRAGQ